MYICTYCLGPSYQAGMVRCRTRKIRLVNSFELPNGSLANQLLYLCVYIATATTTIYTRPIYNATNTQHTYIHTYICLFLYYILFLIIYTFYVLHYHLIHVIENASSGYKKSLLKDKQLISIISSCLNGIILNKYYILRLNSILYIHIYFFYLR